MLRGTGCTSALIGLLLCCAVGTTGHGAETLPVLPPLTQPASNEVLTGKFVWADLLTTDVEGSQRFYTALFDLNWRPIKEGPGAYGILYHDGAPVAGIAYREGPDDDEPFGRWVHYLSVEEVAVAERMLVARGGTAVVSHRRHERRGELAIVATSDGAIIGLMRSSSGDPPDYRAESGEWLWRELYTSDVAGALTAYGELCDFEFFEREAAPGNYLLASQGYLRAGINTLPEQAEVSAWLGYVRVADAGATARRAEQLGGSVLLAPSSMLLDGRLAVIADPAGASLGLLAWDYAGEDAP